MTSLRRISLFCLAVQIAVCLSFAQTPKDSITIVNTLWEDTEAVSGILIKKASFPDLYGGPQQITILEVDTRKHPLSIHAHNGRQLTTENAIKQKAYGAINGTYFDMGKSERSVCYIAVDGEVVDYTLEDLGLRTNGAVILKGHKVKITPWNFANEGFYRLSKESVMSCGPLMVLNGHEVDMGPNPDSHIPQPNPRSGIAVLKHHKVLLIVVDGRKPGKATGVTVPQFAHLCRILGAKSALNLDGGGSSVIWTSDKGILNSPSDGRERTVSNSILVH